MTGELGSMPHCHAREYDICHTERTYKYIKDQYSRMIRRTSLSGYVGKVQIMVEDKQHEEG